MGKALLSFLLLFLSVISCPSFAANKLSLKTYGYLVKTVVDEKGNKKEKLLPLPKEVYPNDVIEYRIQAKNISNENLKNVVITAKIPKATVYIPKSASGTPEFSIDNGKSFQREPVKYIIFKNGRPIEKVATPDMYTNIRWKVPEIAPKKTIVFKYRVKVTERKISLPNKFKGGLK